MRETKTTPEETAVRAGALVDTLAATRVLAKEGLMAEMAEETVPDGQVDPAKVPRLAHLENLAIHFMLEAEAAVFLREYTVALAELAAGVRVTERREIPVRLIRAGAQVEDGGAHCILPLAVPAL